MADLIEKLIQALDAERPALPETQYDIGYNNGLTMAMAIARKFAKDNNVPSKWIPVTERLPKEGECVLAYDTRDDFVALLEFSGSALYDSDYIPQGIDEVTHWMPLPQPPKGE